MAFASASHVVVAVFTYTTSGVRLVAVALQVFSTFRALEVSAASFVVTAVEAVAHAETVIVGAVTVSVAELTSVIPAASAVVVPAVSTVIGHVEVRASEVEIGTVRIASIDAEVPVACAPIERTVEVACIEVGAILPVEQNIAQVEVTALPIESIEVVYTVDAHQIVEVDFVCGLILILSEVQLVSHLVGQEQGLVACLFVTHCLCCACHHEQCGQRDDHSLHSRIFFKLLILGITFHAAK